MKEKQLQAAKPDVPTEYAQKILDGIVDIKEEIVDKILYNDYISVTETDFVLVEIGEFLKNLFEEGQSYMSMGTDEEEYPFGPVRTHKGSEINVSDTISLDDVEYSHRFGDEVYHWFEMLRVDLEEIIGENNRWWRAYAWLPTGDVSIEEHTSLAILIRLIVLRFLVYSIKEYKDG